MSLRELRTRHYKVMQDMAEVDTWLEDIYRREEELASEFVALGVEVPEALAARAKPQRYVSLLNATPAQQVDGGDGDGANTPKVSYGHSMFRRRGGSGSGSGSGSSSSRKGQPEWRAQAPLDFSDLKQAEQSFTAFAKASKATADEDLKLAKDTTAILNRLAGTNFEATLAALTALHVRSLSALIVVVKLLFEKALNDVYFQDLYASMCRRLVPAADAWTGVFLRMELREQGWFVTTAQGNEDWVGPFATAEEAQAAGKNASSLQSLLLRRCRTEFEATMMAGEEAAAIAPVTATATAVDLDAEAEYAQAKAKRRVLAVMKFIGELFKVDLLNATLIRYCVDQLLADDDAGPDDDRVDMACKLLEGAGQHLDGAAGGRHVVDRFCARLEDLRENGTQLSKRVKFACQDLTELRRANWVKRGAPVVKYKTAEEFKAESEAAESGRGKHHQSRAAAPGTKGVGTGIAFSRVPAKAAGTIKTPDKSVSIRSLSVGIDDYLATGEVAEANTALQKVRGWGVRRGASSR